MNQVLAELKGKEFMLCIIGRRISPQDLHFASYLHHQPLCALRFMISFKLSV